MSFDNSEKKRTGGGGKRPEYQQRVSHFLSSTAALSSSVAVTTAASGGSGQHLGRSSPVSHPPRPSAPARPPGLGSLHPQKRRFPAASRQRGPADQLPPPNPGLISGIQATDEPTTRGPAPQGSGGRCRGTRDRAASSPRHCEPQIPHKTLRGKVDRVGIQQLLGESESRKAAGFGGSRSCQWLTLT